MANELKLTNSLFLQQLIVDANGSFSIDCSPVYDFRIEKIIAANKEAAPATIVVSLKNDEIVTEIDTIEVDANTSVDILPLLPIASIDAAENAFVNLPKEIEIHFNVAGGADNTLVHFSILGAKYD
jgi:hypothetical protein